MPNASRRGMAEFAACRGPEWIPYRRADEILHVFERILAANGAASRDRYILAGPPNNGKTALIDRLLARHPPSLNASGTNTRYPVFCPEAPPAAIFRVGAGDILKLASAAERFTVLSLPAWPIDDEFRGMACGLESSLSPKQPIGAGAQATR